MDNYEKPAILADSSGGLSPQGVAVIFAVSPAVFANAAIAFNAIWATNAYVAGNAVGTANANFVANVAGTVNWASST